MFLAFLAVSARLQRVLVLSLLFLAKTIGERRCMIKKMTASDTNSVGKRGVPVSYRGGGGGVSIHATVLDNNSLNTCTQRCFYFSPVSSSSQCCLSHLTHQILHINTGRARKQLSIPTTLTETVAQPVFSLHQGF